MVALDGKNGMRIGWYAKSYNRSKASIRVRLYEPMEALRARGLDIGIYTDGCNPEDYDAVIFSKAIDPRAINIAQQLRAIDRPVIFDLCDNLFEAWYPLIRAKKLKRFEKMLDLATHITYSTATLASQIEELAPEVAHKRYIIPDMLDTLPDKPLHALSQKEQTELRGLRQFLERHKNALHCVWFGKSQRSIAGFSHVDRAVRLLEQFNKNQPVTLTIISDQRWRYKLTSLRWRVPTIHVPWTLDSFSAALSLHDTAIIPIEKNSYTVGKTINRPATAIMAGLGVIADAINAYEELRPFIFLDDWQRGLEHYAVQRRGCCTKLSDARGYLEQLYDRQFLAGQWETVLTNAVKATKGSIMEARGGQ